VVAEVSQLEPAASALVVVDMQNDFCDPRGLVAARPGVDVARARAIIPAIQRAVRAADEVRVPVLYTKTERPVYGRERVAARAGERVVCEAGSWGAEIIPELAPGPDAIVVSKMRYDAFYGTNLELLLHSLGTRALALSGVMTNGCVLATGLGAYHRGYDVVLLADCMAGDEDLLHRTTLDNFAKRRWGVVRDLAWWTDALTGGA
jgi:ureidoacrylate peracid hydrolase